MQGLIKRFPVFSMTITVVLCLGLQAAFSFCSGKKCPPFADAAFDSWFPYEGAAKLYFENITGATDTMLPITNTRTEAYQTGSWFEGKPCGAYATYSWKFASDAASRFSVNASTGTNGTSYGLQLKGFTLQIGSIDADAGIRFRDNSAEQIFYDSYMLNGKTFAGVQRITVDTTNLKDTRISTVYFGKNTGLVAYENFPSHELWVKR